MTGKLKALYNNYKDLIVYILVGGITTVAAWSSKFFCGAILYPGLRFPASGRPRCSTPWRIWPASWPPTFNRWWVFHSKDPRIFPGVSAALRIPAHHLGAELSAQPPDGERAAHRVSLRHRPRQRRGCPRQLLHQQIPGVPQNRARAERGNREEEGEHEEV